MEKQDIDKIKAKGLTLDQVENQLKQFEVGFAPLDINRAAVVGDGILVMDGEQIESYTKKYDKQICHGMKIVKFVPASGAATRMFKDIFEFVDQGADNDISKATFNNISKFAFFDQLKAEGVNIADKKETLSAIIKEPLLYGKMPKALILFHKYKEGSRTALEEHIAEGSMHGLSARNPVFIHYTVSEEHMDLFKKKVAETLDLYMKKYGVSYDISYSIQKPSTDTVAATMDNKLFRDKNGDVVFRPAGHGALIENLNDLDADLIFIKNIDNVQPDKFKNDTVSYKKALAALAVELNERIHSYIRLIDSEKADPEELVNFIENNLGYRIGQTTNFEHLRSILNRPLRVCGMVKNDGEPGGGPFWVNSTDGSQSLQIAESSQIADHKKFLMQKATHFNPVDIICITKDINKKKFDLKAFIDPATGFISEKSFEGKKLKAMERPGLWNGAMSNWNTVFVEVPASTFTPVKTIADLLRDTHL